VNIFISKEYLGTPTGLIFDGNSYCWSDKRENCDWSYGTGCEKDLSFLSSIVGEKISDFSNTKYGKSFLSVHEDIKNIPWHLAMPEDQYKKQLSLILSQLWMIITDDNNSNYMNRLSCNLELLRSLSAPSVDNQKLNQIMSEGSVPAHHLEKINSKNGFAEKSVYAVDRSVTGRLTVISGPNILTMPKICRKIFKSRFKNGKIIEIDVRALEPRIAASMAGRSVSGDMYSKIQHDIFKNKISRDIAKKATISCLFGMSEHAMRKLLPSETDVKKSILDLNRFFKISELHKALSDERNSLGYILNLYGRKINSDASHVNHFLQSTGVDVSLDLFRQTIKMLQSEALSFVPLYIIHDSIVIDADLDTLMFLKNKSLRFNVDKLKNDFELTVSLF
jgi:hypothetical protein